MRLFTGISIEPETLDNLTRLLDDLRPLADLKWSPPENLHITTKFIGHWPGGNLDELDRALAEIPLGDPIPVEIMCLSFFRTAFYAGVKSDPALKRIAELTSDALAALGRAPEGRPYSPHLTLARIGNENRHTGLTRLRQKIADMSNIQLGSFEAHSFHLYLSTPTPCGSVYSILRTYAVC